jgi:integrase
MQFGPEGWVLAKPKTRQSRRQIALSPKVVEALRAHRRRQAAERACLGNAWVDLDLVFPGADGEFMWPSTLVRNSFGRLLVRAGVPHIRFHDLRHIAATLLLARGVNVQVVSEMLGHAHVTITLSIYGHVLPHMQEQAAATMDGLLWEALGSDQGQARLPNEG